MPHFRVTIEVQRVVEADSLDRAGAVALKALGAVKRARVTRIEQVGAQVLQIEPGRHGQQADKVG